MKQEHFRVAIFGSARIKKNDKNYKSIYKLAEQIGERGHDIVTGGGPGIMEAANRGLKDGSKDAHSFGLLIKLPREQKPNKALDIKKEFQYFSKRLDSFMELSNAIIVAPGGIGTLLELSYAWQLIQLKKAKNIPIILMGKQWKRLVTWMKRNLLKNNYIDKQDLDLVFPVNSAKEALKIIDNTYELFLENNPKIVERLRK
jgi:uncharacterized protein (TIGR00730 family)